MDATTPNTIAVSENGLLKQQPRWKKVLQKYFGEYGYLLIAALIPAILFYLIYLAKGLYPFGDGTVLVLDLNGQYVSFYEGLYKILHGDADMLYSFARNLGGEFLGIYDYYVASPFAMILALFPERFMLEALLILFMLKAALCGLNMGIYLHKHAEGTPNRLVIIAFSVMYAMTSYCVVQQHNSMWIDAVLWLPLLTLGIESVIKYGRFRLYVFTLAITVHSNFYIGYMVVIYTVAYCFYYYFAHNRHNENNPLGEKNHFLKSVGRMVVWSALGLAIAALAILSAKYALSFGKDEFSNPNWEITQKFDLFELLYKFLPSSYDTVRPEGLPFVYCGVLTLLLAPAFFLCKKFSNREKVAAAFFILFFVASFATSSLDLIWHGFQKPNWLNYRYSFMLCFFLLVLAYRSFDRILYASRKALLVVAAFIGMYVIVLQKFSDMLVEENEKLVIRPFATIWLTLGCLFVYFILICLMGRATPRRKEVISMILVFVVCAEMFLSGLMEMNSLDEDVSFSRYSRYNNMIDTLRPITNTIIENDDGFYRMEKTYFRKTNDNFALNIKGLSCSTSTLNTDTIDFLRSMGYASRSHWSRYLGGTPVNDSLLGIKYLITEENETAYYGDPIYTQDDYGYDEEFYPNGTYDVYLNPYALSFAYGVADNWLTFDYNEYDNPYERLNAMITTMLGEDETVEVFKAAVQLDDPKQNNVRPSTADGHLCYKVDEKSKAATLSYQYEVPANTELYFYYPTRYLREVTLEFKDTAAGTFNGQAKFGGSDTNRIVSLGESKTGDFFLQVTIDNDSNNLYVIKKPSYIYYIDMDVFADAMERLAQTQYEIDPSSTDSHLTGRVTTDSESQLMFTSIPYDEGWNIYVDGEKVEIYEANNSLVAFYVEGAGEHTVEMKYMPSVIRLGIIVSCAGLIVFIALLILYPFIRKNPYLRKRFLIDGEELPPLATEEYMAEIQAGDVGAPFETSESTLDDDLKKKSAATKPAGKKNPSIPPKKKP